MDAEKKSTHRLNKIQETERRPTLIEEDEKLPVELDISSSEFEESSRSSSDEDLPLIEDFDEEEAFKRILNLKSCVQIVLNSKVQQEIGLEIGPNVSSELPWKQVKKEILEEYMPEDTEEMEELKARISNMQRGELLLVGYAPSLSEDTFLVFDNDEDARHASEIIRKMEAFERRRVKSAFIKYPQHWKSKGSEQEVDINVRQPRTNVMNVEVQSIYPIKHSSAKFTHRLVDDVRDGYVELIPGKIRFDNILRKRIDTAIQSAPPRVQLEQQTDPTFPTNAWSQYLYEIISEETVGTQADSIASEHGSDNRKTPIKNKNTDMPEHVVVSNQVQELLNTLEFNTVDMYRNDYPFIAEKDIQKFSIPYLQESFCFADISKSSGRVLNRLNWHPVLSGVAVASYTFSSLSTSIKESDQTDIIRRAVLEPNPVILWSFDDTLNPKLQLQSPREVTALTFCPYDENLIVGGFSNGQIIIWDLKDRISKVETEEVLSANQTKHRLVMRQFLSWTKEENRDVVVLPAAISALNQSHKSSVTSIQWMNRKNFITTSGQIRESIDKEYRFFVTSSMDGIILFWDLDSTSSADIKQRNQAKKKLPEGFLQEVSEYKKLDSIFRPIFILIYKMPISSFIMDEAQYSYEPEENLKNRKIFMRVKHKIQQIQQNNFRNIITISSFMGQITNATWDGFDFTQGTEISKEEIQQREEYDSVHDGPIVALQKNPFIETIFLSIGRTVFAIWKDGFMWSPILWRKRPVQLTDCLWSKNRPGVFFLARIDGSLEVWDLLSHTGIPCLVESLGGRALTCLSQHHLSLPREALGIGDQNSNFRILLISTGFVKPLNNETELVQNFIDREVTRKTVFDNWRKKWYNENKDIIEARKRSAEEAQIELERLEKEMKDKEELKQRIAKEEERKRQAREAKKVVFDLPERLEKKWDEMNFRRLMRVLMSGKMVDPEILAKQTKPQKELIKYNEKKKEAIKQSFAKINEEIAIVRARLLPTNQTNAERNDFVTAYVAELMEEARNFHQIETEAIESIKSEIIHLNYSQILTRGQQRREIIYKSLGENSSRRHLYKNIKKNRQQNNVNNTTVSGIGIQSEKSVTFSDVIKTSGDDLISNKK